jgi:tetratricopeptide (TPR) repeat protein
MMMARATVIPVVIVTTALTLATAGADPSGYLRPEGDAKTVEKAARVFRDGVRLLERGSTGPALGKFRQAGRLCPGFFEARYNAAKLEGQRGGRDDAVAELEALCRDFPRNVRAYSDLGQLLVETEPDAAGAHFATAVTNGEALLEDEAILAAGASTVAQLETDLAFAYHNRGAWHLGRGEFAQAAADLARSIELNDANFFSHYVLGLTRLQQGRYDEAKAAFKRAKTLKRPFADCSIGLARAYLGETPPQPAAALAELREAGNAAGTTAQIETLCGDCYRLLGELETANERYAKALELGADPASIALKRAVVARDQQDVDKARTLLEQCIEGTDEAPLLARAYRHLGELDELEDRPEAAVAHFARAIELDPPAYGARLHLGACLYKLGRTDEAGEHLAAVLDELGETPPVALKADVALARKLLDNIRAGTDNQTQTD